MGPPGVIRCPFSLICRSPSWSGLLGCHAPIRGGMFAAFWSHNMSIPSHILIADDERSIRLMLETGLTLNGFRVTSARNGREALEAASAGKFDAVLSDIYMPDLGGLELVDALRAVDPNLPIVLMTAQGSLQVAVEAVTRGASDFIGKPFDISAVVDLLRRLLEARREADAIPASEPDLELAQAGLVGRSAPMIVVYKLSLIHISEPTRLGMIS